MRVNENGRNEIMYEPNSFGGPVEDPSTKFKEYQLEGKVGRYPYMHPNDDYE